VSELERAAKAQREMRAVIEKVVSECLIWRGCDQGQ
jgi:hypothetical protein